MADAQTKSSNQATGAHETQSVSDAAAENRQRKSAERETVDAKFRKQLMFRLGLVALSMMPISIGLARVLFAADPTLRSHGYAYLLLGVPALILALSLLSRTLQRLPPSPDDCDAYGRHLVGLTFLLLVIGLSNAVGTSTLAFDGGLGFSAAAVVEASDPAQIKKADAAHEAAKNEVKAAGRRVAAAERAEKRAQETLARACAKPPASAGSDLVSCETARTALIAAEEALVTERFALADAQEAAIATDEKCAVVRTSSKQALFFLLSLSTMMALFGASFYVVNSVRAKRPRPARRDGDPNDLPASDAPPDSMLPGSDNTLSARAPRPVPASHPAPPAGDAQPTTPAVQPRSEQFDVHAFWSGACFRVGEAVLFTFAFFWLIWTSDRRTEIIWLPVLALFVGMFVKTGEAVIFRLGMRVLSAIESLLPAVSTTSRNPPEPATPAPPNPGSRSTTLAALPAKVQ